jgi:transcriptional regulator GlxA family with amidase domain
VGVAFGSVPVANLQGPIDTLIIPGAADAPAAPNGRELIGWVEALAARASRIACVCTGAFLAAEAGLLKDRLIATHCLNSNGDFKRQIEDLGSQAGPILVKDGRIWTATGISAGVDLALALIEEDLGIEVANQVQRRLLAACSSCA